MIKAFYCNINEFKKVYQDNSGLLQLIPSIFHNEVNKYRISNDRYAYVSGILLIKEIFKYFDYNTDNIKKITRNEFSKPFIDNQLSFNISHSGELVACVGSLDCTVAIDIEKIRPVRLNHFKKVFSPEEFRMISNANDSVTSLFELWTKKESIVKADGRGLTISLQEVRIDNNSGYVKYSNTKWYLKKITQLKGYTGHICSSKPISLNDIKLLKLNPDKIII